MAITIKLSDLQPQDLTISTQFNDLRQTDQPYRRCVRDLKEFALFGKRPLIRDADIVNNEPLLDISNDPDLGFQKLITDGTFVFARREGSASFTDVNERAGINRAFPARYEGLREKSLPSMAYFMKLL